MERFSIPYLAGTNKEASREEITPTTSKRRTISTQTQTEISDIFGSYSSILRPPLQPDFSRFTSDFSSTFSSTTDFSTLAQPTPTYSSSQYTRPQDVLLSSFVTYPISSTPPAIAGECCTECCPVAAAEAATTNRDGESINVDEIDSQKSGSFSFSPVNYKSFSSNLITFPQIFGYSSSTTSKTTNFDQPNSSQKPSDHITPNNIAPDDEQTGTAVNPSLITQAVSIHGNQAQNSSITTENSSIFANETSSDHGGHINMLEDESMHTALNAISALIAAGEEGTLLHSPTTTNSFSEGSLSDGISDDPSPVNSDIAAATKRKDGHSEETRCLWSTCAAAFRSTDELIPHLFKSHVAGRSKTNLCHWASCSLEKEDSDELIEHLCADHLNQQQYQHSCKWEGCYLRFETFDELTAHVSEKHIGSGKSQYVCCWAQCDRNGRPFNQRQKVMRHIQTHTGDKPYQCTICKKRFSEANIMTQHMRTHTGERPFKCPQPDCGRRFSISGALTIHMRVHTGEKPFKCKYEGCAKRFAESSNLTKHMRVHTGERPFKCPVDTCSKKFSRPDQVSRHLKTHKKQLCNHP